LLRYLGSTRPIGEQPNGSLLRLAAQLFQHILEYFARKGRIHKEGDAICVVRATTPQGGTTTSLQLM
jgi:hypothetical protein